MTYNGWTNYETWAVKLWMDNDQNEYEFWKEHTRIVWRETDDKTPNQFLDHSRNAQTCLAADLRDAFDSGSDHPVFGAADGTVYADLLNAALGAVEWLEIADALLADMLTSADDAATADVYKSNRLK